MTQTPPTGIAGAADHAPSRATTCHVCGEPMESPHAMRALPGVGAVGACSLACAGADAFRPAVEIEVERLRAEVTRLASRPGKIAPIRSPRNPSTRTPRIAAAT